MAYCVNCGVELAPSEPLCPLCGTEVLHPNTPWSPPRERPYPAYLETVVRGVDKRYFCALAAVLMLIPVLLCVIIDLLTSEGGIAWSGFVAGAIGILMVVVLLPIAWGRWGLGLYIVIDTAAVLAYLLYIDLSSGGHLWFLPLAAPVTLAAGGILWLQLHHFQSRKKKGVLVFLALSLFGAGALTVFVEIFLRVYQGFTPWPHWSWYALVPCALSGVGALILNSRNTWKDSVRKRLFF